MPCAFRFRYVHFLPEPAKAAPKPVPPAWPGAMLSVVQEPALPAAQESPRTESHVSSSRFALSQRLERNDTTLDRRRGRLGPVRYAEFAQQAVDVRLHRRL